MSHRFNRWIAVAGLAGLLIAGGSPACSSQARPRAPRWTTPWASSARRRGSRTSTARSRSSDPEPSTGSPRASTRRSRPATSSMPPRRRTSRSRSERGPTCARFVAEGHVSLDLRSVKASQTFEIDTPNAAFTIEHSGYYRVEVAGDSTRLITRRGGRASVTYASGTSSALVASEQVVISGADAPQLGTYAAPELDAWDRWNYARTQAHLDAASARYVPAGVYGADDLDRHGSWRVVPRYGAIWVPRGVAVGWAPYSAGRWIHDPYYGWSWVDAAPWGWAPYHYGRWVHVSGYWGWAPGPVVVRPRYAPALVAFFGGGGLSVGFSIGAPRVGWVALGWGEPIVPWWGPRGVRGVPRWAGWGGPRVVNNVVVKHKTVIHVKDIRHYQHSHVRNAFVAVEREHFGRRALADRRVRSARVEKYAPVRGELDLRPGREHRVASSRAAPRPSRKRHEGATPQEPPRHRSERSREANRRKERSTRSPNTRERPAPAAPQLRTRKPNPRHTQLARTDAPAARERRVAPASKRKAVRERAGSKRSKGKVRKKSGDGELATPQEPPRHRSERSREASRRKERSTRSPSTRERPAPAAAPTRARKPQPKHTKLARAEASKPASRHARPFGKARPCQVWAEGQRRIERLGPSRRAREPRLPQARQAEPAQGREGPGAPAQREGLAQGPPTARARKTKLKRAPVAPAFARS